MNGMRFSRLVLKNWKNFSSVDVALPWRTFVVGPNAIGKSNFLGAFRFLRDLVLEGGGLGAAINQRDGLGKVRSLYARKDTEVMLRVNVQDDEGAGWRYELAFTHESLKRPRPVVCRELVERIDRGGSTQRLLTRPDRDDAIDTERLTQTALQQVNTNQAFRGLADFLRSVSYLHLVPQVVREEQAPPADKLGPDPYGRGLLDRIRNTPRRTQESRLKRIEKILTTVVPQLAHVRLEIDEQGRPHLEGKFRHWRPNGAFQDERQFSDGTLRLIGFLWSLQDAGGPLLLEEPELSLHPTIVRRLAPFIHRAQSAGKGRQVIVTTHSEHLLTDPGIAPEEIVIVEPAEEGSRAIVGADRREIVDLMGAGLSASEAALSTTEMGPISLFDRLGI